MAQLGKSRHHEAGSDPNVLCDILLRVFVACAATTLRIAERTVGESCHERAPRLRILGEVTGSQNFFTGAFTSNANLETGARNDMKNQASKLGANTVQLLTNRAGQTGSMGQGSGSMEQTNVTYTGAAYKCPPSR